LLEGASALSSQSEEIEFLQVNLCVFTEFDTKRLGGNVDEEIKKLVFVYLIVCLRGIRHTFSKQTSQLTASMY
jgi:hypothetical protein